MEDEKRKEKPRATDALRPLTSQGRPHTLQMQGKNTSTRCDDSHINLFFRRNDDDEPPCPTHMARLASAPPTTAETLMAIFTLPIDVSGAVDGEDFLSVLIFRLGLRAGSLADMGNEG
eukprot:CAMPEP_0167814770 /NCGR_PEP_ID=MMETSP0112_2-20121227/2619_1 /TAXON_ID=91324 /ORGANISM="Lotharella globosa, Strain CCCM811" /LENGTH=117 /DNA_ID=CAMNT_0007714051 /DNA_START=97 /DNA_END=446 /DNA_ORIENTATION=-